jgi:phage gp36-like protein
VREVAAAYRFDPTEVAEYYLRVNQNAERTRRRFEKARKLLDEMSDVE